ncbi:MAG TPA: hypothetical protein VH575_09180 [Gemmataceae bacterium]|jgi:hypothetical protein
MDERLRIFLWMVSGGGLGAVLGGAFGGLTGALYAQSGGAAGTALGRRVADAFARAGERELSLVRWAAIVGAADGFLFLGVVGIVTGILVATIGRADPRWLGAAALGSTLLVGGAAFFGMLAYSIVRCGVWAVLYASAGGLLGAILASFAMGVDNCLFGAIPGLFAGLMLSLVGGRYAPIFRSPHVGKMVPRLRSDAETDITDSPRRRPDADAFRKPEAFEEE